MSTTAWLCMTEKSVTRVTQKKNEHKYQGWEISLVHLVVTLIVYVWIVHTLRRGERNIARHAIDWNSQKRGRPRITRRWSIQTDLMGANLRLVRGEKSGSWPTQVEGHFGRSIVPIEQRGLDNDDFLDCAQKYSSTKIRLRSTLFLLLD